VLRSLNVIGTRIHPPAMMFHSNHGPISYRFPDKRRFQSKIV